MLYCSTCRRVVENSNSCPFCGNGFVSILVCGACGKDVPRGQASCSSCSRGIRRNYDNERDVIEVGIALPTLPGLPAGFRVPEPVPESYHHGRFGAKSEVFMNGRDAEILTKVGQIASLLHVLASEMNNLQGHMESTRRCIKTCRNLAADLQEEIETRRGPQG